MKRHVVTGLALSALLVTTAQAQPAKPFIVLVHGAFADTSSWNRVVPILQHDGYFLLADHAAEADRVGVFGRHLHRHVVVQDLDRQVLALRAKNLARLLLDDRPGTVVRVYDLVADLVQAVLPSLRCVFRQKSRRKWAPARDRPV